MSRELDVTSPTRHQIRNVRCNARADKGLVRATPGTTQPLSRTLSTVDVVVVGRLGSSLCVVVVVADVFALVEGGGLGRSA